MTIRRRVKVAPAGLDSVCPEPVLRDVRRPQRDGGEGESFSYGDTRSLASGIARHVRMILVVVAAVGFPLAASVRGQEPRSKAPTNKPQAGKTGKKPEVGIQEIEPALKGYCPAAYFLQGKAVKGSPAFQSTYQGRLYFLSSVQARKQFDADPEKFLPQFGGLCTTALGGPYGNRLPSDPEVFDIRKGKLYLFSSERAKRAYEKTPLWYIARAAAIFEQPALDGYCVVAYQRRNKAIKGDPRLQHKYRGSPYHFTSPAAREAFISDPERYLPKYDGYCAEGVSRNKRYPADPEVFMIHQGRTYLFFDPEAKVKFMVNPRTMAQKADASWEKMRRRK